MKYSLGGNTLFKFIYINLFQACITTQINRQLYFLYRYKINNLYLQQVQINFKYIH